MTGMVGAMGDTISYDPALDQRQHQPLGIGLIDTSFSGVVAVPRL